MKKFFSKKWFVFIHEVLRWCDIPFGYVRALICSIHRFFNKHLLWKKFRCIIYMMDQIHARMIIVAIEKVDAFPNIVICTITLFLYL